MIPSKWLRLYGTAASAAVFFLLSNACLAIGIQGQSAELATTGSSLGSAAPTPFLVAPSIPLGYAPSSLATGDLRRTGKLDLVTADYNSGKITVFLGTGQGKFGTAVEYDAGPHPSAVAVADINGDGRPDVVVSNETEGTISLLLGNGDGTLQPRRSFAIGFNPLAIATGDFTGTGRVDVAAIGASSNLLALLLSDGNGGLQNPVVRSLSKAPLSLTVADFNRDGRADLALANTDGTVSVLLGNGAGRFSSIPDIHVGSGPLSSIGSADLNKDGKIDLIVTQSSQKLVSVLLGKGDGTYTAPVSYSVGNEPVSTLVADVSGNGVPALVVVNKSSNTFSVLAGNGDGTFKPSVDFVAGNAPLAAVAGDFYGNGHIDLAIINHSSQTVSVPLGYGDGTFKAARSYSAGVKPTSIASGNLNGTKISALVVANYCGSDLNCSTSGSVSVFLADEKGVYKLSSTYETGAGTVSVALSDLKGDGKLDIIALNRADKTASVLLGLGDGTFGHSMTFPLSGAPLAVAVGDLNNDGKPDMAVLEDCGSAKCSQPGSLEILRGAGDGSFQSVASYTVGYSPTSVVFGDINGDKKIDIVVSNRCGSDSACQSPGTGSVLIGDGTGKFVAAKDVVLGKSPASIALGRLTGSGMDLVVSRSIDNTVAVLHGNGDGTFQAAVPYAVGNQPGSIVVADFNGDGKADVAVANGNDSTVSVLFGKGDGTLQPATALAVGSGPTSLTAVGRINTRYASLATTNGNGGSSSPGTEFTVVPNLGTDPALASFAVVASPTTSSVNEMVLLTATLTGVSPNAAPSGTVTFNSGGTALSDCTDVSITQGISPSLVSTATCTTQTLTAGSDSLTAVYSGDTIYDTGVGETSPAVTQTVSTLAATLGLSTSAASVVYGQQVTFTAQLGGVTLSPITPGGTVDFEVGGTTISGCGTQSVDSTGKATCPVSSLAVGAGQVIGAVYSGDTNYSPATAATITETVAKANTTLALGTSAASVPFNDPITFTATVSAVSPGSLVTAPGGTVQFTVGGVTISGCGANSLTAGVATCQTTLPLGASQTIGAVYTGDTSFNGSTATTISQTVTQATTTVALGTSNPSISVNDSVTFTATLSAVSPGALTPTAPGGSVKFTAGGTTISGCGTQSLTAGVATCTTSTLLAGAGQNIAAVYTGDANFAGSTGTTTETVSQLTGTLTITTPLSTTAFNSSVTLTATLSGVAFTPTAPGGTVNFTYGGTTITGCGTQALTAEVATCTTSSLPTGASQTVEAVYTGDANYSSVTAPTISHTVSQLTPTLGVVSSGATNVNQAVTFTATLSGVSFAPTGPNGSVKFTVGGTTISGCGTQSLTGEVATCTTSALTAGASQAIAATYTGDANYATATGTTTQTVSASPATLTVTASPASPSNVDATVTFTAQLSGAVFSPVNPSGNFVFKANGITIPGCTSVVVTAGTWKATCPTSSLLVPADVIDTSYTDTNFTVSDFTFTQQVKQIAAQTVLTSSPVAPAVNQPVTLTATVTPSAGALTILPTGSVTFMQGATPLCSLSALAVNATNSTATCSYIFTSKTTGTSLSATYSGDSNFTSGTPGSLTEVVNASSTTTTLSSTPSTSTVNQQVAFTAVVTPTYTGTAKPTGTVAFVDTTSSTTLCNVTLSGGVAPVCDYIFHTAGTRNVVATYTSGDSNFTGSTSSTGQQIVNATATTTTVVAVPSPSNVNQSVTFTATVSPAIPPVSGATSPTGTVAFSYSLNGGASVTLCASAAVSTTGLVTTATCTQPLPAQGNYVITAAYTSGDSNFSSSSGTTPQSVGLTTTTTAVVGVPSTSTVNQSVTFTATVTPTTSGTTNPSGNVTFSYTSATVTTPVNLCAPKPVSTSAGKTTATCVASLPAVGADTITATYAGDTNFGTSAGTTAQTVNTTATTETVSSSSPTTTVNQSVTFTATIAPAVAPFAGSTNPTGTVAFSYKLNGGASVVLCSAQPVSTTSEITTATCAGSFPTNGSYVITAAYTGDTNFTSSTSTTPESVGATSTTTTVVSSPSTSIVNQTVAFSATVAPSVPGSTNPTGTVSFTYTLNGGSAVTLCASSPVSTLGTVTTAACSAPLPSKGAYTIKATYSGDSNFATSTGTESISQTVNQASTTTTVVSSLPTSAVNQAVTFTATITPAIAGPTNPTGTVSFTYTVNSGSPVALSCTPAQPVSVSTTAGVTTAACTASLPANGNYTITATYSGDANFTSPTPGAVIQPVGLTPTKTTVASSLTTSFVNETLTFTATVTPTITGTTNPTGKVAFTYILGGGVPVTLCAASTVTQATGVATCSNVPLPSAGTYAITATYSGDSNFASSSNATSNPPTTLTVTVNQPATTVSLTSSQPTSSVVNQPVIFTAVISPAFTGATVPTGTVTFTDTLTNPATVLCTATVSLTGTVPPCTFAFLTAATHTVTATYSGDANFPKTTSTVLSQAVNQSPTMTSVGSSLPKSSVNQGVTFTATVAPTTFSGSVFPTGTVTFTYAITGGSSGTLCSAQPVKTTGTITTATCSLPLTAQGTYTVTATYSGDGNFAAGSGTFTQTVLGTGTTTAVVASPSPSSVNQSVIFTATVTPSVSGSTDPTGTVAFTYVLNGGTPVTLCATSTLITSTVTTGTTTTKVYSATCTAPLPTAASSNSPYNITAAYSGDSNFGGSSNSVTQIVLQGNLAVAVTSSQPTSQVNQSVTFTATLTPANLGAASPTATVAFRDTLTGATLCSDVPVVSFTASCPLTLTTLWKAATHPITATYIGDSNFPETTSAVFQQVVTAGPTAATLMSNIPSSIATQTVTFTATVTPTRIGPIVPSGYFTFTSSGTWVPSASCQAAPVAPTGSGTATATCTAPFPSTASNQTITAVYSNDSNFTGSTTTITQVVENFSIANSVTSALNTTPTSGPVSLTQGYATATNSAVGTDPFNPTTVTAVVTSTGGFTDMLQVTCQVTNAVHAVVTDPSCTLSTTTTPPTTTTLSGANGTQLIYTLSASTAAPVGAYTVALVATDLANPALTQPAGLLTVYVNGVANTLSLAQGASGTVGATFNTSTAPASSKFVSFSCGSVWSETTKALVPTSQLSGLKCTGPQSVAITGGSTTVPITISTGTTTAQLERSSTISMATFLGIPLFALMGWVGSRKSSRKNFFRFLGLILLLVGVSYGSGCGGSFTTTAKTTTTGLAAGNYLVQVIGTDQNGNTYYSVVPLDVSSN